MGGIATIKGEAAIRIEDGNGAALTLGIESGTVVGEWIPGESAVFAEANGSVAFAGGLHADVL